MPQHFLGDTRHFAVPSFYLTGRQSLSPRAILPATTAAIVLLSLVCYSLNYPSHGHLSSDNSGATRSSVKLSGAAPAKDDKDHPSQIDTVFLGDPADVPVPTSPESHVGAVHPTITVHLPRFVDGPGLIPDTPAGHLFYDWLAAFNQTDYSALRNVLPDVALAAQIELRTKTGGLMVLSAREVQPGILVFRLRDQASPPIEFLGTLQMRPNSTSAAIAKFSLHAIPPLLKDTGAKIAPISAASPQ